MCIEIFHRLGDQVWLSFIHIQLGIPSYSTIFSLFQIRRFRSLYFQIRPLRIDPVNASPMVWYKKYASGPQVGFRVEVHDAGHRNENNSFRSDKGSMVARNPWRGLDESAFRDHLTWKSRRAGPLLSFSSSWERAMKRRETFIHQGAQDVIVIAVWLEGLEMYDAYDHRSPLGSSGTFGRVLASR